MVRLVGVKVVNEVDVVRDDVAVEVEVVDVDDEVVSVPDVGVT